MKLKGRMRHGENDELSPDEHGAHSRSQDKRRRTSRLRNVSGKKILDDGREKERGFAGEGPALGASRADQQVDGAGAGRGWCAPPRPRMGRGYQHRFGHEGREGQRAVPTAKGSTGKVEGTTHGSNCKPPVDSDTKTREGSRVHKGKGERATGALGRKGANLRLDLAFFAAFFIVWAVCAKLLWYSPVNDLLVAHLGRFGTDVALRTINVTVWLGFAAVYLRVRGQKHPLSHLDECCEDVMPTDPLSGPAVCPAAG